MRSMPIACFWALSRAQVPNPPASRAARSLQRHHERHAGPGSDDDDGSIGERQRHAGHAGQQLDAGDSDLARTASIAGVCPTPGVPSLDDGPPVMNSSSLTVVAVSDEALRSELLDALVDESDYSVVVVETIPRAYSRIRQVEPDLVVVFMEMNDVNACQLLSMLETDRDLSGIPVVTCAAESERMATRLSA